MSVSRRNLKNFKRYQEKRNKIELRQNLFDKINEASADCSYVPGSIKSKVKKQNTTKNKNHKKSSDEKIEAQKIEKKEVQNPKRQRSEEQVSKKHKEKPVVQMSDEIVKIRQVTDKEQKDKLFEEQLNDVIPKKQVIPDSEPKDNTTVIDSPWKIEYIQKNTKFFNRSEEIKRQRNELPIIYQEEEIISLIKHNRVVLVDGTTGCGKSTQIPQMMLEHGFSKILMSQPRKISCLSISARINFETNSHISGYRHRFGNNITKSTKLEVVTDGILLNEIITDQQLKKYNTIIIDEAHECTTNLEIVIPLLAGLVKSRDDFRLIFMSATLDSKILKYFPNAPTASISTINYPVKVSFSDFVLDIANLNTKSHLDEMLRLESEIKCTIRRIIEEETGNILVFLTSKQQINHMVTSLRQEIKNCAILPFHASLPQKDQNAVFLPGRKCILATNYAETGLTIPDIEHVIDSGLQKIKIDDGTKRNYEIVPISKSSADQRKGRAGRSSEGQCYRIYNCDFFEKMADYPEAPIKRVSIDKLVLLLYFFKIKEQIFIHPIDNDRFTREVKYLSTINAIKNDKISKFGEFLVNSRFSIRAALLQKLCKFSEINLICAILDYNSEFPRHIQTDTNSEIFAKLNFFVEQAKMLQNGDEENVKLQKHKIYEVLKLAKVDVENYTLSEELKQKIAQKLFLVYSDNLCFRIGNEYFLNNEKVTLSENQKEMNCEMFVCEYFTRNNGKLRPVNVIKVEKFWLAAANLQE